MQVVVGVALSVVQQVRVAQVVAARVRLMQARQQRVRLIVAAVVGAVDTAQDPAQAAQVVQVLSSSLTALL
jgi:hypothetical protein